MNALHTFSGGFLGFFVFVSGQRQEMIFFFFFFLFVCSKVFVPYCSQKAKIFFVWHLPGTFFFFFFSSCSQKLALRWRSGGFLPVTRHQQTSRWGITRRHCLWRGCLIANGGVWWWQKRSVSPQRKSIGVRVQNICNLPGPGGGVSTKYGNPYYRSMIYLRRLPAGRISSSFFGWVKLWPSPIWGRLAKWRVSLRCI